MTNLPTGTVTFLFTDLVISTRLWEHEPEAMRVAMARHDEILREATTGVGGRTVKGRGDGIHAVFTTADAALRAAIAMQLGIGAETWQVSEPLRIRIGIHTGVAELRDGDYFGAAVNRAARLEAAAHGGQIVCSQATADLARDSLPADVKLVDLGEHSLRDLTRAERVFQIEAPGLEVTFPRLESLNALPTNLPTEVTSFVGRERDVTRVVDALVRERIVTLTGVGGVGKTRLALHAAADVLPRFRDGVWLCDLAPVRDAAGVVNAVASVLGVSAQPGATLDDSLLSFLHDQLLLLVLDNCEHLLDGIAELTEDIIRSCEHVAVLATSREPLAVEGERVLGVRSLRAPGPDADLASIERSDAVQLFVDRARSVKDGFRLTAFNAADVARICLRLDGVPLAIELAAARVTAMTPAEISRRLDQRFDLLAGGRRRAVERHQTLRATVDWSYELLTEPERRLLDRLSVFAGGCTAEAVEAVAAEPGTFSGAVLDHLTSLVLRSLVEVDSDDSDETRYRLLETIRQYGEEHLAARDEADEVRALHCDYYTDFAALVSDHFEGPEQVKWAKRLARERDNLQAAMAYAIDRGDARRALRLIASTPTESAQVDEIVWYNADAIVAIPVQPGQPEYALLLLLTGMVAWRAGDSERAEELLDQAIERSRALGTKATPALRYGVWSARANIASAQGRTEEAVSALVTAAELSREDGRAASASRYLARAARLTPRGDERGRAYITQSLALARESGMPHAIATSLLAAAELEVDDDPQHASRLVAEAVSIATELDYESPFEQGGVAMVAARLGDWPTALRAASKVIRHDLRASVANVVNFGALFEVAAAGMAEARPEDAAILQGVSDSLAWSRLPAVTPRRGHEPPRPGDGKWLIDMRASTRARLARAIGTGRLLELYEQGASLERPQADLFARAAIDGFLATVDEPS